MAENDIIKLQHIIFTTIRGGGNLKANKTIKQLTGQLYADYGINYHELQNAFFLHCLEKSVLEKFDKKKAKLNTFITTCCRNYLIDMVRAINRERQTSAIFDESIEISNNTPLDLYERYQKTPEDLYFENELSTILDEFIYENGYNDTHGEIFLSLLMGWTNMNELSKIWPYSLVDIKNGFEIFKYRLKNHLVFHGYDSSNISN